MCVLCMYAYEDFLSISFFLFVLLRKPHNHLFYSTAADSFKKRFHYASSALQTSRPKWSEKNPCIREAVKKYCS